MRGTGPVEEDTASGTDTTSGTDTAGQPDVAEDVWGRWFRVDTVTAGVMNTRSDMNPWDPDGTLADVRIILYVGFPPSPSSVGTSDTQNNVEYFNWVPTDLTVKFGPEEILRFEIYDMDEEGDDLITIFDVAGNELQTILRNRQGIWTDPDENLFNLGITFTAL